MTRKHKKIIIILSIWGQFLIYFSWNIAQMTAMVQESGKKKRKKSLGGILSTDEWDELTT